MQHGLTVVLLHWQPLVNSTSWMDVILISWILEQTPKQPVTCDDKEGHYIVTPDDIIYKRCRFSHTSCLSANSSIWLDRTVRLLGQGTFGKVVEAVDIETNKRVAIKIIRAIQKYREASRIEVRVLQKLKERDPS